MNAVEEVRRLSGQLLGNKYRLEVVEALCRAGDDSVTATSIHEETGIKYARVQEELKRLKAYGVLRELDTPGAQTVEYKIEPTVYWELCKQLLDEICRNNPP
jgi:DNA-binding transcriptional regulator GbsR (MarR family)